MDDADMKQNMALEKKRYCFARWQALDCLQSLILRITFLSAENAPFLKPPDPILYNTD